jgi:hypothetical protein
VVAVVGGCWWLAGGWWQRLAMPEQRATMVSENYIIVPPQVSGSSVQWDIYVTGLEDIAPCLCKPTQQLQ